MRVPLPSQVTKTSNNIILKRLFQLGCLVFTVLLFTACVNPRKLVYFPDQRDTTLNLASLPAPPEPVIQENDVLSITVSSLSPAASAIFNAPNTQAGGATSSALGAQTGYLVATDGKIDFPILGKVKAAGFTKPQLADNLVKQLLAQEQLKDPIVTIRQLNYHITLIGEVGRPGVYNIPSEKINMLEALGQGGDLTPYANRKTVVLIREEEGKRIFHRIDLNSSKILSSPYYYLKSNDIIYAEPNEVRATSVSNQGQIINYVLTGFGFIISLITFIITVTR
jgi:polysaccharide biosynthesis/export protein